MTEKKYGISYMRDESKYRKESLVEKSNDNKLIFCTKYQRREMTVLDYAVKAKDRLDFEFPYDLKEWTENMNMLMENYHKHTTYSRKTFKE